MSVNTELYHCTSVDLLKSIIESGYFRPSYCLEQYEFWDEKGGEKSKDTIVEFSFAMVCFADLLEEEVERHMSRFGADSYIVMTKEWAQRQGISPVVYYYRNSVTSHILKLWIHDIMKHNNQDEYKLQKNLINAMIPFYKLYKGHYYNKNKDVYSDEETLFYCEREWRFIPLVQEGEAYYLPKEDFMDESLKSNKIKELVEHNYILRFSIDDIVRIHVPQKDKDALCNKKKKKFKIPQGKALSILE